MPVLINEINKIMLNVRVDVAQKKTKLNVWKWRTSFLFIVLCRHYVAYVTVSLYTLKLFSYKEQCRPVYTQSDTQILFCSVLFLNFM